MLSTRRDPADPPRPANTSGSTLEVPVFSLAASLNTRIPGRELRALWTRTTFEKPFRRTFLARSSKLDGLGSTAMTLDALVAAFNAYRPMCAPTSTTTSSVPTRSHSVVKGSCLREIKSKSLVRGFFFQAEDGIRDLIVTGVQTC